MLDPTASFQGIAKRLNAMRPDSGARCFFECMSGGLIWTDERPSFQVDADELGTLRIIWNYRTSLILGKPRTEFTEMWDSAVSLAPNWPGFLPVRREPSPELSALIPKPKKR